MSLCRLAKKASHLARLQHPRVPSRESRVCWQQQSTRRYLKSLASYSSVVPQHKSAPTLEDNEPAREEESKRDGCLSPAAFHLFLAAGLDPSTASEAANAMAVPTDPVWNHFLETLISTTVPSVVVCSCIGITVWMLRQPSTKKSDKKSIPKATRRNPATELWEDLYADSIQKKQESPLQELMKLVRESSSSKKSKKKELRRLNQGMPSQEFIHLKHWNQTLDSYQFSVVAATQSKAKAAAEFRSKNFDRALRRAFYPAAAASSSDSNQHSSSLWTNSNTKRQLLELERIFLKEGSELIQQIHHLQTKLTRTAIDDEMEKMGVTPFEMDPPKKEDDNDDDKEASDVVSIKSIAQSEGKMDEQSKQQLLVDLGQKQKELMQLELNFVKDIVATMGTEYASGIRVALLGDIEARGSGGLLTQLQERPLTSILGALSSTVSGTASDDDNNGTPDDSPSQTNALTKQHPGSLFVARFSGDLRASQVSKLREEVTAIVRNARPGLDEALVVLESGGGTVTGYGLAAGQLQRLKDHGIKLTIAVEQVAASGGYMMCCVADRIVGSPFAIFGSIGVATEIPNVYDRLKTEGIEFQTVTAGKYKRTITPFKQVTDEDYDKTKEQLEGILRMFKGYVQDNRPQLAANMDDKIATGDIFFGEDAVSLGLCDEIRTADEVMNDYVDAGWEVYELEYKRPPRKRELSRFLADEDVADAGGGGVIERTARWLIRVFANEMKSVVAEETRRYSQAGGNIGDEFRTENGFAAQFSGAEKFRADATGPRK